MTKPKNPVTMTRDQAFQKTIDIITNGFDATAIAQALAKANPVLFVELHAKTVAQSTFVATNLSADHFFVVDQIRDGSIVTAIKKLREMTGFGLKHAKDVVDHVRGTLDPTADGSSYRLDAEQQAVYEQLVIAGRQRYAAA